MRLFKRRNNTRLRFNSRVGFPDGRVLNKFRIGPFETEEEYLRNLREIGKTCRACPARDECEPYRVGTRNSRSLLVTGWRAGEIICDQRIPCKERRKLRSREVL